MRIILIAFFAMAAVVVLLAGLLYPQLKNWSYLAAGIASLHGVLALVVAWRSIADAGRIAAWCWQGISTLLCIGLLLAQAFRNENGWFLAVAALIGFTLNPASKSKFLSVSRLRKNGSILWKREI